jgi:hypothetical protein
MKMSDNEFEAAVGLSRKWDAREAGREVARSTIEKLNKPPSFLLLFSTIHYEKYGGFEEFLKGVWDVLPNDIPLIGGTVPGFMNNHGCYTRGATALAVSSEKMKIGLGIGKNTKRSPEKAAKQCIEMINKNSKNNADFKNKILFVFISGSIVPSFPGMGMKRVVNTKIPSSVVSRLLKTSLQVSQKGVGREEIIIDEISKLMPNFSIIGGSSIDDNKMEKNYQFFNKKVFTNSVVSLSVETDFFVNLDSQVAVKKTDNNFEAKTAGEKYVINKIDGKPATKTLFNYLHWPESFMDERLHRRTFFYPILFEKDGEIFPEVIGVIVGNSIVCGFDLKSNKLTVGHSSRETLLNAIKNGVKNITKDGIPKLSFVVYCSSFLEALGRDFFEVQRILKKEYEDNPFLLIAAGGEDFRVPNKIPKHCNETINTAAFSY